MVKLKKQTWKKRFFTYVITVFIIVLSLSNISIAADPNFVETFLKQSPKLAELIFEDGIKTYQQGTVESLRQAVSKLAQALQLFRQINNKRWEAITSLSIGRVYHDLGEKQKALAYYDQAMVLYRKLGDKIGEAQTFNNIGAIYSALGEKQKALSSYDRALPLFRALAEKAGEATTLNNMGALYSDLGEKQQAIAYYEQALPLRRAAGDESGEATTLNNIGRVYSYLEEKQQALLYFDKAFLLFRKLGNKSGEAQTLNNIGAVYSDLQQKQKAIAFFDQALPLRRAIGDKGGEAQTLNNIGAVYFDLGDKQKAFSCYDQAIRLYRAVSDRSGEAIILSNLAVLERSQNNLQAALTHIEAAIKIIEVLRTKIDSQDLRTSYFASVQNYYQFQTDLLMQLHKSDPSQGYDALAFHTNERSRSRVLIELLTEANANIRKGANPELLEQETNLLQKIEAQEKLQLSLKPQTQKNPTVANSITALKKETENLLNQYRKLQTKIRTSNPEYAALKYPEPLKLSQIQQQLDKNSLLLQYSLGENRSYLWAVTPNSLHTYELPGQKQIEDAANNFRDAIFSGNSPYGRNNPDLINKPAFQLAQIILAPAADKLGKKRLVVVADGVLQNIPFAALADPQTQSPYKPLIINHEIVNLPSVTALLTHRQQLSKRKLAPKTFAVLADPVFAADDERVTGKASSPNLEINLNRSSLQQAMTNFSNNKLPRLVGTRKEAEKILKLMSPSQSLHAYDFDANYNFVNSKELKQYRYLQFATHGILDPKNPELSGIVLSQFDKQGKPIKGYLRLGDIFNLDLGAELVVLSACETGLGQNVRGEGLLGLTRGLMYAGAKRAVVSLWQVDDEGTSQLMPLFYQAILKGNSAASALHDAQMQLLQQKEWQNPYYWAAFTLQGDWK
jgi:CHAT domain-containing protein/tetratricopeptide (TPR) repeat protein